MPSFSKAFASSFSVASCPPAGCAASAAPALMPASRLSRTGSSSWAKLLQAIAVGILDVALGALAHVFQFGHRAQVLLPVAPGALLGLRQRLLQRARAPPAARPSRRLRRIRRTPLALVIRFVPFTTTGARRGLRAVLRPARKRPPGGFQRLEFKAAPSSLAVMSTMGMTRS